MTTRVKGYSTTRYTKTEVRETLYAVKQDGLVWKANERKFSNRFDTRQGWERIEKLPDEATYIGDYDVSKL